PRGLRLFGPASGHRGKPAHSGRGQRDPGHIAGGARGAVQPIGGGAGTSGGARSGQRAPGRSQRPLITAKSPVSNRNGEGSPPFALIGRRAISAKGVDTAEFFSI